MATALADAKLFASEYHIGIGARDQLESLTEDEVDNGSLFQRAREVSHSFRDGLLTLFFDTDSKLTAFTRQYGVF